MRPGCVMACRLHSAPRTPHSALREVREGAPGRNRVVWAHRDGQRLVTLACTRNSTPGAQIARGKLQAVGVQYTVRD